MRTTTMRSKLVLLVMAFVLMLFMPAMAFAQEQTDASSGGSSAPTIQSDKEDYPPGGHVVLTGSNWQAGESVNIFVNDDEGKTWQRNVDVVADQNGDIRDEFDLPDWFVATYQVTATGDQSGTAKTSFTDANVEAKANLPGTATTKVKWVLYNSTDCTGTAVAQGPSGGVTLTGSTASALTGANKDQSLKMTAEPSSSDNKAFDKWTDANGTTLAKLGNDATTTCQTNFNNGQGIVTFTANYAAPSVTATSVGSITASTSTYGGKTDLSAKVAPAGAPGSVAFFVNGSTTAAAGTVSYDSSTGVATLSNYEHKLNASTTAYSVRAVFTSSSSSYSNSEATNSSALTVNKKAITVTPNSGQSKVYGSSDPAALTYTNSPALESGDSFSGKLGRASGESVGNYAINLGNLSAGNNYALSLSSTTVNFAITQKSVTGSFTAANKTYDGNNGAEITGRSLEGKVGNDDVSLSGGSASFSDKNVGTDKVVTLTGATLAGSDAGNYSLGSVSGTTANITAKQLTGAITAENKVYDGNTSANATAQPLTGVIGQEKVSLAVSNAKFDSKDVGDRTVSADLALAGADKDNYELSQQTASASAKITKKALTVTAKNQNSTYGSALPANDVDYSGFVANENVTNLSGSVQYSYSQNNQTVAEPGNAGTYAIVPSGLSSGNYEISFVNGTLTIDRAAGSVEISNIPSDAVFGGSFTPQYTKLGDGAESVQSLTTDKCSVSDSGAVNFIGAGTCKLKASVAQGTNHLATTGNEQSFQIAKANPSISLTWSDSTYNGSANAASASVSGVGNADLGSAELTYYSGSTATGTPLDGTPKNAGTYTVTAVFNGNANYNAAERTKSIEIAKAAANVSLDEASLSHTYSGTAKKATATVRIPGGTEVEKWEDFVTYTYKQVGVEKAPINAGSYQVRASLDSRNFVGSSDEGTLVIGKAPLTVKANDATREYGEPNPTFGASYTGFVNNETKSVLRGAPSLTTGATQSSDIGNYAITASADTLEADNYSFTFEGGALTITKAPLTIKANNAEKTYGQANPAFTGEIVNLAGVKNNDQLTVSASSEATTSSDAGIYPIVPALRGDKATNYEVTPQDGTLTIGQATPAIEWNNPDAITYGTQLGNDQLNAVAKGVGGAELAGSFSYDPARDTVLNAGDHQLKATFTPNDTTNYKSNSKTVQITVNKATTTLSLNGLGPYTYNGSGFASKVGVDSDPNVPDRHVDIDFYSDAEHKNKVTDPTDAGTYYVVASMREHANYTAAPVKGELQINQATATLSINGLSKTYNGSPQGANVTTNPAGLSGVSVTYNGSTTEPTNAGSYTVEASLNNRNYAAQSVTETLVIGKATPNIHWSDPAAITYGTPLSNTQLSAVAKSAGNNVAGSYTYSPEAGTVLNAGNHTLRVAFTPNDTNNYNSVPKTEVPLTVNRAPITVDADNASKSFNDPHPTFTYKLNGFVNGENETTAGVSGAANCSTTVAVDAAVGSYNGAITCAPSNLSAQNYNFAAGRAGTLTIGAWNLVGFYQPIGQANSTVVAPGGTAPAPTNTTVWNTAKGGSTIPLKFNIFAGNTEKTSTADVKSFGAQKLSSCSGTLTETVEELSTSGSTSLRYDTTEKQFIQNWKTPTVSAETCYRVALTAQDGSTIYTFVKLRK
jgi:hypothetical protein